jgi:hypothetical protein
MREGFLKIEIKLREESFFGQKGRDERSFLGTEMKEWEKGSLRT